MGISYAVVTKVKELTETRQYGEALDLLEGEDIFQSLNPQFLRSCGEVYLENERFYESREALVRAHIMAPEGNRIIYDLVRLYLKMGYFQRAKLYYEIYIHHAVADDTGKLYLQYMIQKAQRVEAGELLEILEKACEEQYSDEWGFELALLYASLGRKDKMKEECIHLMAAFRNSPYCALAEALKKEEYDISNSYFRFPLMEAEEDKETYASILEIEEKQLEKDLLKVHPPAPVILQMEDDDGTEEEVPERKEKGFGIRLPFRKKQGKNSDISSPAPEASGAASEPEAVQPLSGAVQENGNAILASRSEPLEPEGTAKAADASLESEDVSAYIESVMKSVADIEASVAEELQHPMTFQSDKESRPEAAEQEKAAADAELTEEKPYQPKLFEVEDTLSPKERLEKLMQLIEEERQEDKEGQESVPETEEELDLDEFLMNLVGANTITQAMVKSYRDEKEPKD
ncbi:MAG: hypothetical protein NC089_07635 [Bacteroides sp.]|nr:hypothetical protein [Bacteroides sp.]MCM1548527.1 hypothetical protein [Clostridium sp.]